MKKNKKILSLEDIKNISLEGLKYFKKICEENNLKYFLAYGTLIGAVRHKGFIPWDDDIDIWMPREDYDKLIAMNKNIENDEWQLISSDINKKYLFYWAKLCNKKTVVYPSRFNTGMLYGISIDIFPIDKISNERQKIVKEYYDKFGKYCPYTGGIAKSKLKMIKGRIRFYLSNILYGNISKMMKDYRKKILDCKCEDSKYVSGIYDSTPKIYEEKCFEDSIQVEFEHEIFNAPAEYDKILTNMYGDYMKLPPEEKRITHHSYIAYFK